MFRELEVLTFAVEIEKNGREFYQTAADIVEDEKENFEKDSILFFNELRKSLHGNDQASIDNLIAEEKKHIQTLTELKNQF